MNGPMNTSVASQKTRGKLHWKIFERIKESKWGTPCKSLKHKSYSLQLVNLPELQLLLKVQITKIKIAHHSYRKQIHSERNINGVIQSEASSFTGEHPCRSAISIRMQVKFIKITLGISVLLYICRIFSDFQNSIF